MLVHLTKSSNFAPLFIYKYQNMFIVNIYLKLALIAVGLIGGIIFTFVWGFGYSWIFFLIGLIFLVSYFLLGTIQSATELLQKMDFDGAEKRLNMTIFPKWLYVTNRAFYYILKGSLAAQRKDNNTAEEFFKQALALNLPTDNEKGMVLLQMAGIQANKNNWAGAKKYFHQTRGLKITESQLKDQLKQMESAINNSSQIQQAQKMGFRPGQTNLGGKRRRPKMR